MEPVKTGQQKGNVSEVIRLAWPIVVSMLSYTAMGVADTLFVGWIGKTELAAVGLATTAFFLVNGFFLGALNGVKVVSAQATGAKDHARAVSTAWQGTLLALPFGAIVILIGLLHEELFALLGGSSGMRALAGDYLAIRVYSGGLWYVTWAICNAMQGMGDTRTPMLINIVANGLNVVLDPIFIFGLGPVPAMGVEGAAIATVIACGAGMVLSLALYVRAHGFEPRLDGAVIKQVLSLGLPIGVRFFLEIGGWTVFTALLARMGDTELAANQIAISIIKVSFMPGYAISDATCILAGNYFGANDPEGIRRSFHSSLKVAVVFMAICGLLFWIIPGTLIQCFQDDPEVLEIGRELLWVAAFFQIFDAVAMVAVGALNGVGDTRYTMYVAIFSSWLVLVPLAYLLGVVLGMGALGAWLGLTVEILFMAAILTRRFYGKTWGNAPEAVSVKPA